MQAANFYPGWCFAIPAFILRLPWAVVECTLWACIVYFAVGFSTSTRFLMFWCGLRFCMPLMLCMFACMLVVVGWATCAIGVCPAC